jgi:hypothetical protein
MLFEACVRSHETEVADTNSKRTGTPNTPAMLGDEAPAVPLRKAHEFVSGS